MSQCKNAVIVLFLLLVYFSAHGQQKVLTEDNASRIIENAKSVTLRKDGSIAFTKIERSKAISPNQFITKNKKSLGLNADSRLESYKIEKDKLGFTTQKFKQFYKEVEVLNAVSIFHQKDGKITAMNGRIVPDLQMDVTPTYSKSKALHLALDNINAEQYKWEVETPTNISSLPKIKLAISSKDYSFAHSAMRLVYCFDIYAVQPLGRYHIEIDAKTGEVVNKYNLIHHVNVPATGVSHYNGTVNFTADSLATNLFNLRNNAKNITTRSLKTGLYYWQDAEDVTSVDNHFDADSVKAAVSVHWATEASYDYFFDKFGISGYNNGIAINAYANYGVNQTNAFWDGTGFYYGDGNFNTDAHVCLDIVGHEYTHAITFYSGGLVYSNEQGALNESFSDIFGHNIEVYKNLSGASWSSGNEVFTSGGSYREMSNPKVRSQPDTYQGEYWEFGAVDNGGVHTNSGVQNYWYYLLADGGLGVNDKGYHYNVQGIGLDKAAQIAYRNLTVYITPTSSYADARVGAEQAAIDLFGAASAEYDAVYEAWNAVGVPFQSPVVYAASPLDFNEVYVSYSDTLDLNILNLGLGDLAITNITSDNPLFGIDQTNFTIASNSNHIVKVNYSPTLVQADSAILTITSATGTLDVKLYGTGIDFPIQVLSSNSLTGTVPSGDSLIQSFFIKNTGLGDLNWNISLAAPLSANLVSGTIASADSTEVTITFDANGLIAGDYPNNMVIHSNNPVSGMTNIPYLISVTGTPEVTTVDNIQLGTVYSGVNFTKSIWLNNTGYDTLKIDSIRYSSTLVILDEYDGIRVPPLDKTKISILFSNMPVGVLNDSIIISSNAGTDVVHVAGIVNQSPITMSHDTLNFTIYSSHSDSTMITLTNLENADVSWDLIASDTFKLSTVNQPPLHTVTKAALISAWDASQLSSEWNDFNAMFSDVELDITSLNKPNITYQDLVNSGADVLILGRIVGGWGALSDNEIAAVIKYVNEGHGLVGYYGSLTDWVPNHNRFAPLWGLSKHVTYLKFQSFDNQYNKILDHEILEGLPDLFSIYSVFNTIPDAGWNDTNLHGKLLAKSPDEKALIVSNFNRIYYSDYRHNSSSYESRLFLHKAIKFADKGLGSVGVETPSGTLTANGTEQVQIKMHAKGLLQGSYQYFLNLHDASGDQLIAKVPINLNVIGIPIIDGPNTLAFANTNVGSSISENVIIENVGAADLIVNNIVTSGTGFSVNDTFPIIIPPYSTHSTAVVFQPDQPGDFDETLVIMNNDTTNQNWEVNLTGIGVAVPQMNVNETAISITLIEGDSTTRSINIGNIGTDTLFWNGSSSFMDVMEEFALPQLGNGWAGAVYLNDKIYLGHYHSGSIYTFDPATHTFDLAFTIPAMRVNRMTTDGSEIYMTVPGYGIYKYNLNGSLTDYFTYDEKFNVPISYRNSEIWFARREIHTSSTIRKMDLTGTTTGTYPITPNSRVQGMDWVNDSTLLILEYGGPFTLKRYNFDGSEFTLLDTVPEYITEFGRDLTYKFPDVWSPTYEGNLQRIDFSGNAMILSSSGMVLPDSSMQVDYEVKTVGLSPGNYVYHLDFTSNDIASMESLIIPIHLTVLPAPTGNSAPMISQNDVTFLEDENLEINLKENIEDVQDSFENLTLSFQVLSAQSAEIPTISNSDLNIVLTDSILHLSANSGINGLFEIEIEAEDPQSLITKDTILVEVKAVNDAPTFNLLGNDTIPINSGAQERLNFAYDVDDNDHDSQNLNFIVSNDNVTLFKSQPVIDALGQLSYEVNTNKSGNALVYVNLEDDGGVAFGGSYLSLRDSFRIIVPNQVPVINGSLSQLSTFKNTPLTISLTDLSVADLDHVYPNDFSLTVQNGSNYTVSGNTITPAFNFLDTLFVPVMVSDGVDNSNPFTLKIVVVKSLPVELNFFHAEKYNEKARLHWQTETEQNNAGFEIDRGVKIENELSWESIGYVVGRGSTSQAQTYSFDDTRPVHSINYYRLKQIDFDGEFEYSPIKSLDFSTMEKDWIVFPNPGRDLIQITRKTSGDVKIQLINPFGQVVQVQDFLEGTSIKMNIANLPAGQYLLKIKDSKSNHETTRRIVIFRE